MIKSKIAEWLSEKSKDKDYYFEIVTDIRGGMKTCYRVRVMDCNDNIIDSIHIPPKFVTNDDVKSFAKLMNNHMSKLTMNQVLSNWDSGYFSDEAEYEYER